jgi:hypothetical protein
LQRRSVLRAFPPHAKYTGQDVFFPLDKKAPYRLVYLPQGGNPQDARDALVRFLVTAAYLNAVVHDKEQNFTMLVHTSGKKLDHEVDRITIEEAVHALTEADSDAFDDLVTRVHSAAQALYPAADPDQLTSYVVENASRASLVVLNSLRDRKAAGDSATEPSSPFTIIIGGNIVSRGVTFPNLLSMFFTRNVKHTQRRSVPVAAASTMEWDFARVVTWDRYRHIDRTAGIPRTHGGDRRAIWAVHRRTPL